MPRIDMKSGNVTLRHLGNLAPPAELEESASHHLSQRYHWSKGVPFTLHEDGVSGNLAVTGHLEESASQNYYY